MRNLDQQTYFLMTEKARSLLHDMNEWIEQIEDNNLERQHCVDAKANLRGYMSAIYAANIVNKYGYEEQVKDALTRVEQGSATVHDADTLRGAIK